MTSSENFIQDFHSLEGVTLGERKSNLNKILKSISSLPQSEIEFIFKNLNPQTYLENLFKIDFLIAFKRTPELLEILKEGNEVFVSKIVKNTWFLQEAFAHIGPENLVYSVLPKTSFSARMKILSRLSACLEEDKVDEIFNSVNDRYGLFIAKNILHRCSARKIEEIIINFTVDLTSSNLKIIYLKNPKLIEIYFTECEKKQIQKNSYNYFGRFRSLIQFILHRDANLCIKLCEKFKITLKVGRRFTKKFLQLKKDEIMEKPAKYKEIVNLNSLYRHLGHENSKKFIENFMDVRMSNINYDEVERNILRKLPKKLRYSLFSQSFESKFNTTILNNPKLITRHLLKSLDRTDQSKLRLDLVKAKLESEPLQDTYIKYLPTNESIPSLKEKLRSSSTINDRKQYLDLLIDTCTENEDYVALSEVLKYFYERHRNDRKEIHHTIEWKLDNMDKKKFTAEIWKYHNDLQKIRQIKFGSTVNLSDKMHYIEFLFENNKLDEDEIVKSIKKYAGDYPFYFYDKVSRGNQAFRKYLLILFLEKNELLVDKEENKLKVDTKLIDVIDSWNEKHKDDQIVIENNPRLMKSLITSIEKNENLSSLGSYLKKILRREIQVEDRDFYVRTYLKKFNDISFPWFLKYEPQIVSKEIDSFLKLTLRKKTINLIKKYSHLKLDEKIIDTALKSLEENPPKKDGDADRDRKNEKLVNVMCKICSVDKFIDFANAHKPPCDKFDVDTENAVKLYKLRCEIARGFKNFTGNPKIVLPSLLDYCVGDYFGSALGSLRKILCHTPEDEVSPIIEHLFKSSVSIRKHALSITCEICDLASSQNQLEMLKPGHNVTKRRMMKTILGYFRKNPSDRVYEIIKPKMKRYSLDEDFMEGGHCAMTSISTIPKKYQSGYVEFVWSLPKEDDAKTINKLRETLLGSLYEDAIKELPFEFCKNVLKEIFFKDSPTVRSFASDLLVYHPENLKILKLIFDLLDENNEPNRLFAYFSMYFNRIMIEKHLDREFLETFSKYWEERINPTNDFDNYVRLQFFKLKMEHDDKVTVADFNDLAQSLFKDLITKYGPYIISPFGEVLKFGVKFFAGENEVDVIKYYQDLLQRHSSTEIAILVMEMLQPLKPNKADNDKFSAFKSLMYGLKAVPDPGVQIVFKRKYWNCLKDLE